jgi:Retinal pigment epithelial membrane protein
MCHLLPGAIVPSWRVRLHALQPAITSRGFPVLHGLGAGEDDGYLLTIIYDEATGASEFVVYDAKTMAERPLARVALPQRVPYGFHSTWVTRDQLAQQWGPGT